METLYIILVRKHDNVDECKLLSPWVDVRRLETNIAITLFGLIKYRVRRNPRIIICF